MTAKRILRKILTIRWLLLFIFSSYLLQQTVSYVRSGYFLKLSNDQAPASQNSVDADMNCAHKCLATDDCRYVSNGIEPETCVFFNSLPNLVHYDGLLRQTGYYQDCLDAKRQGINQNSVQPIALLSLSKVINVYCDMEFDGGGWIVIQRRLNGHVSFERNWQQYKDGFGDLNGDFWIGLEYLHALTTAKTVKLHIELKSYHNASGFAEYTTFSIAGVDDFYRLNAGGFTGNVGDGLSDIGFPGRIPNGQRFSTYDKDNDPSSTTNCASVKKGGWWFNQCYHSHLNGVFGEAHGDDKHISWIPWRGTVGDIKFVEMKIKAI